MGISGRSVWKTSLLAASCLAACSSVPTWQTTWQRTCDNPFSPRYRHDYRYGALPTREIATKVRAWEEWQMESRHPIHPAFGLNAVTYGGGIDGIGVTSGTPRVYLVFYGSQWASGAGGDPNGVSTFLQALFTGIGTGGEQWSGTVTQYCDGPTVATGARTCNPATTPHVGYPRAGALAGAWFDTAAAAPANATVADLAQEAIKAAAHFGNTSATANRYAQYLIVSPTATHPDGFGLAGENFCAWHYYTSSSYGDIAYSNLPYVSDAGSSCGANFVNKGAQGILDAFSIVAGHEYAETVTDQVPPGGWTNPNSGEEVGDPCSWISSGQGATANVTMGNGTFAMQGIWSNDTNRCEIAHVIR